MTKRRTGGWAVARAWSGLMALFCVLTLAFLALWVVLPMLFGLRPVRIVSGSMAPVIRAGDVVLSQPSDGAGLGPGTVVVFQDPVGDGLITHRIVAVTPWGSYVTKGDANARSDSTPLPPSSVVGVGYLLVPVIALPAVWLQTGAWLPFGGFLLVVIAALVASRWAFAPLPLDLDLRLGHHWSRIQPDQPAEPGRAPDRSTGVLHRVAPMPVSPRPSRHGNPTRQNRWWRRGVTNLVPCLIGTGLLALALAASDASAAFADSTGSTANQLATDMLDAPTSLTATGTGPVTLTWAATADSYASGHRILRSSSPGGPYSQIAEITPRATTTYVDSPPDGTYYYVARAFYLGWESINSNQATASVVSGLIYSATGPSSTRTSSGTMTVNFPSGTQQNDVMLLVEVNAANQAITTPSGWALLADAATSSPSQFRFTIWWKLAATAETSVNLSVNTNSSGATAWVIRYIHPAGYPPNPVTATAAVAIGTGAASTTLTPTPDITTNQANATVISIVAIRSANALSLSTPQSFALQITAVQNTVGQPRAIGIADRTRLPLPSTPVSPTWSQTGTPAQWAWATIAFS